MVPERVEERRRKVVDLLRDKKAVINVQLNIPQWTLEKQHSLVFLSLCKHDPHPQQKFCTTQSHSQATWNKTVHHSTLNVAT